MSKRRRRAAGSPPLLAPPSSPAGYSHTAFLRAVAESAPAVVERTQVREATFGGATVSQPGRIAVRLVRAGWSLNGNYYPAEVLRRDGPNAWREGTLCYVDHASEQEEQQHPAGSVRNLAAVLTTAARWDDTEQALMAEARLFAPWRETITDMADAIGMSIRAWVTGGHGEAEGREGFIIESIPEGRSVDFVTVPAAGGAILSVLESVGHQTPVVEARNLGVWLESRLHLRLTELVDELYGDGRLTRDERTVLSTAVAEALQAWVGRVESDAPQLFQRDMWQEPEEPEGAEEASTVRADDSAVNESHVTDGAPPNAPNPPNEEVPAMSGTTTGVTPAEAGTAPVADTATETVRPDPTTAALEAVTAQLADMRRQLAEQQARAEQQETATRAAWNRNTAVEAINTALRAPDLADVAAHIGARVTDRITANVPTTADGSVDVSALGEAISRAVADEAAYVRGLRAETLEAHGIGQPYGLGARTSEATDDGFTDELADFFTSALGMTTEQAKIAARGRN